MTKVHEGVSRYYNEDTFEIHVQTDEGMDIVAGVAIKTHCIVLV